MAEIIAWVGLLVAMLLLAILFATILYMIVYMLIAVLMWMNLFFSNNKRVRMERRRQRKSGGLNGTR